LSLKYRRGGGSEIVVCPLLDEGEFTFFGLRYYGHCLARIFVDNYYPLCREEVSKCKLYFKHCPYYQEYMALKKSRMLNAK